MDRQKEFVLRTLEERDIRFVRLWFTDVLGYLKSVAIAPAELEGAFEEGIGFDGSSIEGFARVSESDTVANPDPSTFQVLPWATPSGHHHSARMFCDITMPDGSPSWADPRHVLRRQLQKANDLGFSCYVHPEIEFFLLKPGPDDGSRPIPVDNAGYFDQAVHDSASNFRRDAIEALEFMGISVEFSHHEGAPGQQEIDLRFADALSMADNVMTFRYVIKEVAIGTGARASFMPKPFAEHPGSAMHTHMSLFEGDVNAFHSTDDPLQLSDVGKSFIAGILEHASEISAVTNQWVNSYKRLIVGYEAPVYISWARNNRSALVRVPPTKRGKKESTRIEYRAPDSSANPYLAFAAILAAGLAGVERGYELPPEADANLYELTAEQRLAEGIPSLPGSLSDAIAAMETSELMAETLGEHVFEWFIRNKRAEWADYKAQVTSFELRRYLTSL
jgi:glutamine synthetase